MSLKLIVGISKKLGLPRYSSAGASCCIEVEVDPSLLDWDPEGFQRYASQTYDACRKAVESELARQQPNGSGSPAPESAVSPSRNGQHRANGRQATPRQVRALRALADRHGIDLTAELRTCYAVDQPEQLNASEAGALIATLQGRGAEPRVES